MVLEYSSWRCPAALECFVAFPSLCDYCALPHAQLYSISSSSPFEGQSLSSTLKQIYVNFHRIPELERHTAKVLSLL
ncbi:hypothetical protein M378DRAFT_169666 [Amanita muscaria Koide BX008]|uniref:Uncharacterized protein n=1 Tax=Amanita muscaria (strain Koide BX008) TaxID=946122 RepID=A0A0C2WQZ7_AMAMK|nr:hypothetical protein M378DRAFT_169666 [Amanita muscaria Koide BX008]